jgi:hypothetical protein
MNNAAEKRRIMAEERRMRTYHGHAQANIDEDRGGRFAVEGKATVIGSGPISYPAQPSGSPWHSEPIGTEPPLGYSVGDQEPVGEVHEREATPKFKRRF